MSSHVSGRFSRVRGYAFEATYYAASAIFALTAAALSVLPGDRAVRGVIKTYTLLIRWLMERVAGISIEVRGREHLPDGAYLIAAKHQSWGDGFVIYPEIPKIAFVTGDHLLRFPLLGRILGKLGAIVIDTCGGGVRKAESLAEGVGRVAEAGRQVLIYPEGHLAAVGTHYRYKPGVWHMQKAMQAPIVPVATNLGLFWPGQSSAKRPGRAVIEILEPIPAGLPKAEAMTRLSAAIEVRTRDLVEEAIEHAVPASVELADPVKGNKKDWREVARRLERGVSKFQAAPASSAKGR